MASRRIPVDPVPVAYPIEGLGDADLEVTEKRIHQGEITVESKG